MTTKENKRLTEFIMRVWHAFELVDRGKQTLSEAKMSISRLVDVYSDLFSKGVKDS